jgi:DUF4097 and DUF4098 domain-containing protein YvlB
MHTFETPGDVSLDIRLSSGRVVVSTADEPQTTVEVIPLGRGDSETIDAIEVRAEPHAGGHLVTIEQKQKFRWGPLQISWGAEVEVRVTCPPGSNLDLDGGSTDLRVDGELGDVSVKTASGDVKLADLAGTLEIKTASGDVWAGSLPAGGRIVTVSGDVWLARHESDLYVRTVSGDVRVANVRGPFELATTSGDLLLESVEEGEVRVQAVSGDVRIGVGHGTRVWIDAASVSGDLTSHLGIENDLPEEGELEAPVVPLQVKTVSGDVQIDRATKAFSA